jgi:hypothetical protein
MPKTQLLKGNKAADTRYHIRYYNKAFFDPAGELEEGQEPESKIGTTVKLPVKIDAEGGDSRANVTYWEIKGITHFENNVENVLDSIHQLQQHVIKPKGIENPHELITTTIRMMGLICNGGTATQTLQETGRIARQGVYDTHLSEHEDEDDEVSEDILVTDESAFIAYIEDANREYDEEVHANNAKWTDFLYTEYKRMFWNHLHSIIFGPNAYKAFKDQKNYMMNKIIKPFGVSVDAAFRRVDAMATLLPYFPPPAFRGEPATAEQWEAFEAAVITSKKKKEMKYNLLPDSYHDRFDSLETDWNAMSMSMFLSEAQKCEALDKKEQAKLAESKAALKKKKTSPDEASTSALSRSSKSSNSKSKKRKNSFAPTEAGKARLCVLCQMAGAPEYVFKTHNTENCNKKDEYQKKLSGSAGSRKQATREYKKSEKELTKELKIMQKRIKKLEGRNKKRKTGSDSSVSSMDTDVSY